MAVFPSEPFDDAIERINAWRGSCLQIFARVEMAVSHCLIEARRIDPSTAQLPPLVGLRFNALSELLKTATNVPRHLVEALEAFRVHDKLRHAMCHGVATVLMDRNGRWSVKMDGIRFHSNCAEPFIWLISEAETHEHLAKLQADSRKLSATLGQLRKTLSELEPVSMRAN